MDIDGKPYIVSDIMRTAVIVKEDVALKDVLTTLIDEQSNFACVVDADGKLIGGVSTLDVIRAILPDYMESDSVAARFADAGMLKEDALKAANKPVSQFVDHDEAVVKHDANLVEATVISSSDCTSRIIVVDDENKPIGVLSRTEIKKVLAAFLGIRNELPQS